MQLTFPVKTSAGVAINVGSGYTFAFAVAPWRGSTSAENVIEPEAGQYSTDDVDGTNDGVIVSLTSADTDIAAATYHWDLRVTTGSTVKVVAEGPFVIHESVTD